MREGATTLITSHAAFLLFSLPSAPVVVYHKSGKIATMSFPKDQVRNKYEIDPDVSLGSNVLAVCSLEGLVDVKDSAATAAVVSRFQRKVSRRRRVERGMNLVGITD